MTVTPVIVENSKLFISLNRPKRAEEGKKLKEASPNLGLPVLLDTKPGLPIDSKVYYN